MAAGVAIDNARLYEDSRLRERWLRANAEITHSLMSGSERSTALGLIAERAREIAGSALAAVAIPMEETKALTVEIAVGVDSEAHQGLVLPVQESLMGLAYTAAAPVTSDDVAHDARISPKPPRFGGLGPAVAVPIGTGEGGTRGVVLPAREVGRPAFSQRETEMLQGFAAQAAIARELAEPAHEGLPDTDGPREVAEHVVAVLSEALTDIARHAHAGRAEVALTTDGRTACLTVRDDGVGIPPGGRRSGLRNMAERAERLGGHLQVSGPDGGGARLEWRIPLPTREAPNQCRRGSGTARGRRGRRWRCTMEWSRLTAASRTPCTCRSPFRSRGPGRRPDPKRPARA